jgi:hypothetical protein
MNVSTTVHLKDRDNFKINTVMTDTNYLQIDGGSYIQIFFRSLGQMQVMRNTIDEFLVKEYDRRERNRTALNSVEKEVTIAE